MVVDRNHRKEFNKSGIPKTVDIPPEQRLRVREAEPRQWLQVDSDGRVVKIVVEHPGTDTDALRASLVERYGEPDIPADITPETKTIINPFGNTVIRTYRETWNDEHCGLVVLLIRQTVTKFYVSGWIEDRSAVVVE